MARSEARIKVAIWKDRDFRGLTLGAQWLYQALLSQPDMTNAGVVPLRESRWARLAADTIPEQVSTYLSELVSQHYVVVDDLTGEALVRTFMRNDEVWKQPNVLRSAQRAIEDVESPAVLAALVPEVETMIKLDGVTSKVEELLREILETLRERLAVAPAEPFTEPQPKRSRKGSPKGSGKGSANPSPKGEPEAKGEGGVVTEVGIDTPLPIPPSHRPPAGASAAAEQPLSETQRSKRLTDAYAKAEPMCKWPAVNEVVRRAIRSGKYADEQIEAALLRMAKDNRSVTVDALRTELQGLPPSRYGPPSQRGVYRDPANHDAYDSWTKGPTR